MPKRKPKRSLTAQSVARIKPPSSGQAEYFDGSYPGLALRVSYGGTKSWVYFYRLHGKLHRLTLGKLRTLGTGEKEPDETKPGFPLTLAGAREAWREASQNVAMGRDPARIRHHDKGANDFESRAREWLKRDQLKNRSHAEVQRVVERELIPAWGPRRVDEIEDRDVLDLIDSIADRGTVVMARRVLAYVHRFFQWEKSRRSIKTNPAADLPKPGVEVRRDRVLTDNELIEVWRASEQIGWPFGDAIRLLLLSGARREEIGQLRWSEIDGATIRLNGDRTKNAEAHDIPLSSAAVTVLKELPRIDGSDFVFTTTGRSPLSGWSFAKRRLDCLVPMSSRWRVHDLRRTVATGLQRLGVNLQTIEAVLGHVGGSRSGVVGVYQRHSFDAEKRAALEAWGAHVMTLVGGAAR